MVLALRLPTWENNWRPFSTRNGARCTTSWPSTAKSAPKHPTTPTTILRTKTVRRPARLSVDSDAPHVAMIKSQLAMLNSQLAIIMEKRRKKRERKRQSIVSASSTAPASYYSAPSAPVYGAPAALPSSVPAKKPGKRGRKRKNYDGYSEDEKMPEGEITYEQKRELSDNINILPPEKLPLVFEIIKENAQLTVRWLLLICREWKTRKSSWTLTRWTSKCCGNSIYLLKSTPDRQRRPSTRTRAAKTPWLDLVGRTGELMP